MKKKLRRKIFIIGEYDRIKERRKGGLELAWRLIMTKREIKRPLVIKSSPKRVPITHIRTNMRTAGMSRERYFQLLEKVK